MARTLPDDCTLMPLGSGRLLLSRSHAVYCRVPPEQVADVEKVLAGEAALASLSDELQAELRRHGFFDAPRPSPTERSNVQLQLTNACTLRCKYCSTNAGAPMKNELPKKRWFRLVGEILDELPDARLVLLGGEPFDLPWAIDLAEDIVLEREAPLVVFTNGLPFARSKRLARRVGKLAAAGAVISVSLPGASRGPCDAISGGARFDAAIAGINAVAAHGPPPEVQLVLTPDNVDDIATNLPALRAMLPPGTEIILSMLGHRGRERGRNLFASQTDLEAALDRVTFEAGERIPAPVPAPTCMRREGCACALGVHMNVRADGRMFTCFKMEELAGDLRTATFAEVFAGARQKARPARELPVCRDCQLATLCGAGCRSENLILTGDADVPACGPWRVRVLCELLAQDRPDGLVWPAHHLLAEAKARSIDAPDDLVPVIPSRALTDARRRGGR